MQDWDTFTHKIIGMHSEFPCASGVKFHTWSYCTRYCLFSYDQFQPVLLVHDTFSLHSLPLRIFQSVLSSHYFNNSFKLPPPQRNQLYLYIFLCAALTQTAWWEFLLVVTASGWEVSDFDVSYAINHVNLSSAPLVPTIQIKHMEPSLHSLVVFSLWSWSS